MNSLENKRNLAQESYATCPIDFRLIFRPWVGLNMTRKSPKGFEPVRVRYNGFTTSLSRVCIQHQESDPRFSNWNFACEWPSGPLESPENLRSNKRILLKVFNSTKSTFSKGKERSFEICWAINFLRRRHLFGLKFSAPGTILPHWKSPQQSSPPLPYP